MSFADWHYTSSFKPNPNFFKAFFTSVIPFSPIPSISLKESSVFLAKPPAVFIPASAKALAVRVESFKSSIFIFPESCALVYYAVFSSFWLEIPSIERPEACMDCIVELNEGMVRIINNNIGVAGNLLDFFVIFAVCENYKALVGLYKFLEAYIS